MSDSLIVIRPAVCAEGYGIAAMMVGAVDRDATHAHVTHLAERDITGVDNTVFISPRGNARHGPRIKIAIDPPDSLSPHAKVASMTFDGQVIEGSIPKRIAEQARAFINLNRDVLVAYWNYEIATDELQQRLQRS
jgi:hypothetical protein